MNNDEIQKSYDVVSKELEINYDKNKTEHYGLSDRALVPFATIKSTSRVVRSEGTDEDNDIGYAIMKMVGLYMILQFKLVPECKKVIEENITPISPKMFSKNIRN